MIEYIHLTTDDGYLITTDDGYLIIVEIVGDGYYKNEDTWTPTVKGNANWTLTVKGNATWQHTLTQQTPYLYDDATKTYDSASVYYDYLNTLQNQSNTLNTDVWAVAAKGTTDWEHTATQQVPYLYDDATKTYDSPSIYYDYLNVLSNQANTLNATTWSLD